MVPSKEDASPHILVKHDSRTVVDKGGTDVSSDSTENMIRGGCEVMVEDVVDEIMAVASRDDPHGLGVPTVHCKVSTIWVHDYQYCKEEGIGEPVHQGPGVIFVIGLGVVEDLCVRCPVEPTSDAPKPSSCSGRGYWSINQCGGSSVDEGHAEMSKIVWDIVINLSVPGVSLVDGRRSVWLGTGNREVVMYVRGVDQRPVTISSR